MGDLAHGCLVGALCAERLSLGHGLEPLPPAGACLRH